MNKTKHAVAVVAVVVGRVSDSVTRQLADADIFGDVGLRDETANPTYGTANDSLFAAPAGVLHATHFQQVRDAVIAMLRGGVA